MRIQAINPNLSGKVNLGNEKIKQNQVDYKKQEIQTQSVPSFKGGNPSAMKYLGYAGLWFCASAVAMFTVPPVVMLTSIPTLIYFFASLGLDDQERRKRQDL